MKKFLAVFLAALMLFAMTVPAFAADGCDCGNSPVIFVSGFGATELVRTNDDGSEEMVFPPTTEGIVNLIKNNLDVLKDGGIDQFALAAVHDFVEPLSVDENGNSVYNIRPVYSSVEDTSYEGFVNNDATGDIPYGTSDFLDMKSTAEKIGADHVFNFLFDWRLSSDEVADEMLEYIEEVREYTGHDQVSIYCLSQGTVPVAQYLYKYSDKGYIDNCVFDNPILDGSTFVSDILCGDEGTFNLDLSEIVDLAENILHLELNLSEITDALPNGEGITDSVNAIVKQVAEKAVLHLMVNAPAFLEMLRDEDFDRVIKDYNVSDEVVAQVNMVVKDGYRSDIEGTLRKAMADGVNISLVSCSGFNLVTGTHIQSDAIVNLESSCGAYCLPEGETFPMDYVQKVDTGKNNISPDRTIDLSCGYVPERTWIVNERYHGQCEWGPNSLALIENLLYTDDLTDAYSSYEFPQFIQSNDYNHDIWVSFDETNCLTKTADGSDLLNIANTSAKTSMIVTDISVDGESIFSGSLLLPVGGTASVNTGISGVKYGRIVVTYASSDAVFVEKTRDFGYTSTDNYTGVVNSSDKEADTSNSFLAGFAAKIWAAFLKLCTFVKKIFNMFG